jgi:hypothetical protein
VLTMCVMRTPTGGARARACYVRACVRAVFVLKYFVEIFSR